MEQRKSAELPRSMALAWGVAERGSRGPKRALTIDRIVAAGIEIAAGDGLGAVSMARVAERLGVSTMALYRYVESKDDLLELMVDAAIGPPPRARPGESWRDGMRRWAEGVRDGYRANQWALRVPISGPPLGPNNMRWMEAALAALRDTPLSVPDRLSCLLTVVGFVRSEELLLADLTDGQRAGRDPRDYAVHLARLVNPHDFPEICAALTSGNLDDEDDIDHDFEFGIERILDGIEMLIAREEEDG